MIAPGAKYAGDRRAFDDQTASLPPEPTDKNLGSALAQATLTATLSTGTSTASVFGLALIQSNYVRALRDGPPTAGVGRCGS